MINTSNLSLDLKKRFCKDANVPITLFAEPYFTSRIKSFDRFYGTKKKYNTFVDSLAKYDCEQDFFEDYNRVKDEAINFIKKSSGYKTFNNEEDMNKFAIPDKYKSISSKGIYHHSNIGKSFVSIDMKSANFTSLHYYDSGIFANCSTWEDFMRNFTDNPHFIESKYIRQVILGNCNPARHTTYEKYLMSFILKKIEELDSPFGQVISFSNDEIVLDVTSLEIKDVTVILGLLGFIYDEVGIPVRHTYFSLKEIPRDKDSNFGYIKYPYDNRDSVKIKCADSEFLPIIVKKLDHREINKYDYYFSFKGELAKFATIPKTLKSWDGEL